MHTGAIIEVHGAWLAKNWSRGPKVPRSTAFSGATLYGKQSLYMYWPLAFKNQKMNAPFWICFWVRIRVLGTGTGYGPYPVRSVLSTRVLNLLLRTSNYTWYLPLFKRKLFISRCCPILVSIYDDRYKFTRVPSFKRSTLNSFVPGCIDCSLDCEYTEDTRGRLRRPGCWCSLVDASGRGCFLSTHSLDCSRCNRV